MDTKGEKRRDMEFRKKKVMNRRQDGFEEVSSYMQFTTHTDAHTYKCAGVKLRRRPNPVIVLVKKRN